MKIEISRDDLRCLVLGKYCLMNEFTFDSSAAKHFSEGALFMFDFIQRTKMNEKKDKQDIKFIEIEQFENEK